ncbi:hypothetical protein LTR74_018482 [Friedmanniomyces endolithicus]|nr:hypothetical protein LTR74_018482 [Friedmanniomyces endolithicus]
MYDFERDFGVYDQFRIVVCISCQFAVVPSQIREHLRKHHRRFSSEQCSRIFETVNGLRSLARDEPSVVYPPSSHEPIDHLPVFYDGLKSLGQRQSGACNGYVCRTVYGMQEHCKGVHGWINKWKQGGDVRSNEAKVPSAMWKRNCACHRFFNVGKWQRYFQVAAGHSWEKTETAERSEYAFFRKRARNLFESLIGQDDNMGTDE